MNDSPVDCQSHRTDRSIFSAEKIQDRRFESCLRNQKTTVFLPKAVVFLTFSPKNNMGQNWVTP